MILRFCTSANMAEYIWELIILKKFMASRYTDANLDDIIIPFPEIEEIVSGKSLLSKIKFVN